MATWGMAQAKAQFSEVVHDAEKVGPQTISRSGREVAVVVSIDQWRGLRTRQAKTAGYSLAESILNSPLHGMHIPKLKLRARKSEA